MTHHGAVVVALIQSQSGSLIGQRLSIKGCAYVI
jgi:hypothetical protein